MRLAAAPSGAGLAWHLKRTLALAWPVMIARAGLLVMAVVDVVMIGRVSGPGLAHYGLAMAPFLFFMLTGTGLLVGTVVLVAQAHGAGQARRCGAAWRLGLLAATGYALPVTALLATGPVVMAWTGQAPELASAAGTVLQALAPGLLPMLLFTATSFLLEGLGRPAPGMVVMVVANVLNAALNALLLFGWWGLPEMGATGAALATTFTRWFMAATLVAFVLVRCDAVGLGLRGPLDDLRGELIRLLRLGVPIAGANALESAAFTTMSLLAGWLGAVAAAAYLVCSNLSSLIYMLTLGLSTAAAVRVGNAIGRRDRADVPLAGWAATGLGLALTLTLAPGIAAFRAEIAGFYTSDSAVVARAAPALWLAAGLIVVDAGQGVLIGALRGAGDVRVPLLIQVAAYLGVAVPVGYGLAFALGLGIAGLIAGLTAGLGTAMLLLAWRFVTVCRGALAAA